MKPTELTENMKAMLTTIAETAHGTYNGGVTCGLYKRGLLTREAYKGMVLTEKGYYLWLFLRGDMEQWLLEEMLKGVDDETE